MRICRSRARSRNRDRKHICVLSSSSAAEGDRPWQARRKPSSLDGRSQSPLRECSTEFDPENHLKWRLRLSRANCGIWPTGRLASASLQSTRFGIGWRRSTHDRPSRGSDECMTHSSDSHFQLRQGRPWGAGRRQAISAGTESWRQSFSDQSAAL